MNAKFKGNGQLPGHELIHDILKYWYWFLSSVLIFIAAAFFYCVTNPPVYVIKTVIEPRPAIHSNVDYYTNALKSINDKIKLINTDLSAKNKKQAELKNKIALLPVNNVTVQPITDKKQKDILKAIVPYLKNAGQQYELIPTTFPIKDPSINDLIFKFNKAQSDKQHLLNLHSEKTIIAAADNKITAIRDVLQSTIDNTQDAAFKDQSSVSNRNLINDSLSATKTAIDKDISAYASLNYKKQAYEQLYKNQRAQSPQVKSIQSTAVGPNAFTIYFTAFLCGLFLPFGVIIISRKVKQYAGQLRTAKNTSESKEEEFVFSNADDNGLQQIAEKIKRLISERNKTIMISSLSGAIDKNAICQALAQYLSKKRTRVVIIDINFDNHKPGDSFKTVNPGLKDFIFNKVNKLEDIISSTHYPGISTISLGHDYLDVVSHYFGAPHIGRESIDKNQKKLIVNSPKLAFITEKLSQKFDCVLINSTALDDPAGMLPLTDLTTFNLIAIENKADKKQQMSYLQQLVAKYSINDTYALLTD